MRRALTTGLVLYLGLGRVLGSPAQVQAPFELNHQNISKAENASASASEFQQSLLFLLCLPSWRARVIMRALRSTGASANPTCCDPGPPRKLQGRFLHITDLHPDPLYRVGGSVSSGCHRKRPKKEKNRAGYLGTPYEFVILSRLLSYSTIPKTSFRFFGSPNCVFFSGIATRLLR